MIKEIQEEPMQEQSLTKDIIKKDETSKINENIAKNQNITLASDLKELPIRSESPKSPKKEYTFVNKENIIKNGSDENNSQQQEESKIESKKPPKKNLTFSTPISYDIYMNNDNKIKTPLRQDSHPFNFKQKTKVNFQKKLSMGTYTGNEFKSDRYSISMISPICSYFDGSQKILSEKYNEENLFNLTGQKNKKKTYSNKDKNLSNSESKIFIQPKTKKSNSSINKEPKEELEIDTLNFNDFNLFTDSNKSPDYYNKSQISSGLNNLYGNTFSRKLSQATGSNKEGDNGPFGDNENRELNMNLPLNENNKNFIDEEYYNNYPDIQNDKNINNDEISKKIQFLDDRQIIDNVNLLLGNLSNPGLNIDNNINKRDILMYNDHINNLSNQFPNNEVNNTNNNIMNLNRENLNKINQLKNLNFINNNIGNFNNRNNLANNLAIKNLGNVNIIKDLNNLSNSLNNNINLNNFGNFNNNNVLKDIIIKSLLSENQNQLNQLPLNNQNIPLQYNLQASLQNLQNLQNIPNNIQNIQNLLNLQNIRNYQQQIQDLNQNI